MPGDNDNNPPLSEEQARKKILEDIVKLRERTVKELESEKKTLSEILDLTSDVSLKLELQQEISEKDIEIKKAQLAETEKQIIAARENGEAVDDLVKSYQELHGTIRAIDRSSDFGKRLASGLGSALGMANKFEDTMLGSFKNIDQSAEAANAFFNNLKTGLKQTFTPMNMFASLTSKIVESTLFMAKSTDDAVASLNRMTGASGKLNAQLTNNFASVRSFGIGIEELGQTTAEAAINLRGLGEVTDANVGNFAVLATQMQKGYGVAASDTISMTKQMIQIFGKSGKESQDLSKQVVGLATNLKMGPQELMSTFKEAMPQLSMFGNRAGDIFAGLARTSKKTGVEMGTLMNMTDSMMTFEGAADAAATLNAMLGKDMVNAMDLMAAAAEDPNKAIAMIKDAVLSSGQSIEDMSPLMKKGFADALKIPVPEFLKLMNGEVTKTEQGLDKFGVTSEDMAKALDSATSLTDALKGTMASLAITMQPVMDMVKSGVLGFNELITSMDSKVVAKFGDSILSLGDVVKGLLLGAAGGYGIFKLISAITKIKKFVTGGKDGAGGLGGLAQKAFGASGGDECCEDSPSDTAKNAMNDMIDTRGSDGSGDGFFKRNLKKGKTRFKSMGRKGKIGLAVAGVAALAGTAYAFRDKLGFGQDPGAEEDQQQKDISKNITKDVKNEKLQAEQTGLKTYGVGDWATEMGKQAAVGTAMAGASLAAKKVMAKKAEEQAKKSVGKTVGKTLLKSGAKTAGKVAGKLIPGVGLVLGAMDSFDRFSEGDFLGSAMSLASGIASTVPGVGTAISVGLEGALLGKDMYQANQSAEDAKAAGLLIPAAKQKKEEENQKEMFNMIQDAKNGSQNLTHNHQFTFDNRGLKNFVTVTQSDNLNPERAS